MTLLFLRSRSERETAFVAARCPVCLRLKSYFHSKLTLCFRYHIFVQAIAIIKECNVKFVGQNKRCVFSCESGSAYEIHVSWMIEIRDTFVYKHTPPVSSFLLPSSSPTQLMPKTTSSFLCLILSTLPFLGGNSTPQNVFPPLPPTPLNGEPSD